MDPGVPSQTCSGPLQSRGSLAAWLNVFRLPNCFPCISDYREAMGILNGCGWAVMASRFSRRTRAELVRLLMPRHDGYRYCDFLRPVDGSDE
eukprot:scaffold101079_cov46-Prasinocladus_malaysianus.AAC.1